MCGTKVCSTQRALMTSSPFRPKQREYCAKSRVCISRPFSFPPVFIFPRSRLHLHFAPSFAVFIFSRVLWRGIMASVLEALATITRPFSPSTMTSASTKTRFFPMRKTSAQEGHFVLDGDHISAFGHSCRGGAATGVVCKGHQHASMHETMLLPKRRRH